MSENTIIYDDSFQILPTIPDNTFDLILTDPPYDLTQVKKNFLHEQFTRIVKAIIVFSPPENQWIQPADQYLFWIKPISTKNTSRRYSRFVEMIFCYGDLLWNTDRHWSQYTNVFMDLVDISRMHPYRKPPSLIERLLRNHTDAVSWVLDPFAGSETVHQVCKQLNRNSVSIEIAHDGNYKL